MNAPGLKWFDQAFRDLEELVEFIASDNPEAARRLRTEIFDKARLLPDHPRLYRQGRLPGTREIVVRRNYIIVYTETAEAVTVLRVLHAAMKWP